MLKFKANEYKFVRRHCSLQKESENISGDWMNSREWRPQENTCIRTKWQKGRSIRSSERHVTRLQISWPPLGLIVFRTYGTLCHHPAVSSLAFVSSCHNFRKKIVAYPPLLLIYCVSSSYNLLYICEGTGLYVNATSPLLIV